MALRIPMGNKVRGFHGISDGFTTVGDEGDVQFVLLANRVLMKLYQRE